MNPRRAAGEVRPGCFDLRPVDGDRHLVDLVLLLARWVAGIDARREAPARLAVGVGDVVVLGTFGAISGLAAARSGPQVNGTFFEWKSASGTLATLAQSARTAGQSGRSPALTEAVYVPARGSGPSMNVAPPVSPSATTLMPYGTSDAICSATAAIVPAMLRTVPRTASVTELIRPWTNASPWLDEPVPDRDDDPAGQVVRRRHLERVEQAGDDPVDPVRGVRADAAGGTARRPGQQDSGPAGRGRPARGGRRWAGDGPVVVALWLPPPVAMSEANRTRTTAGKSERRRREQVLAGHQGPGQRPAGRVGRGHVAREDLGRRRHPMGVGGCRQDGVELGAGEAAARPVPHREGVGLEVEQSEWARRTGDGRLGRRRRGVGVGADPRAGEALDERRGRVGGVRGGRQSIRDLPGLVVHAPRRAVRDGSRRERTDQRAGRRDVDPDAAAPFGAAGEQPAMSAEPTSSVRSRAGRLDDITGSRGPYAPA